VKNHESDAPLVPNRRIAGDATAADPLTPEEPPLSTCGSVTTPAQCDESDPNRNPGAPKGQA
jgi:hypothetical protein